MKLQFLSRSLFMTLGIYVLIYQAVISGTILTAEDLSQKQADETKTTVAIDLFGNGKRAHKHSKHEVQFIDNNLGVNQELTKTSTSFSSLDIGIRDIGFMYRKMHPQRYLYGYLGVQAGAVTEDGWTFKGLAKVEVPTKINWNIGSDSRLILGFESTYSLNTRWNLLLGLSAETGMRATNVQPIVGAQYLYKNWIFHAVYPSPRIIYTGIEKCQLSLNLNQLYTAVRARTVEHHKKGVALIEGTTAEFRVDYEFSSKLNGWLSIGRIYGAKVTTGNSHFHDKKQNHVHSSMYGQIGLSYVI